MEPRHFAFALVLVGCGPSNERGEGESGGQSRRCTDPGIEAGLVGQTRERICDVEGDCVMTEAGVVLGVYDRDAQIDGALGPGRLDPDAVKVAGTSSGEDGGFVLELPLGTWFVCATEATDMVTCSNAIEIGQDDPLHEAYFEHGNGSSWTVRSCTED